MLLCIPVVFLMASKEIIELIETLLDKKLKPVLDEAKEITIEIADVLKSVEFLSNQYESLRKVVKNLNDENVSLRADLFKAHKQFKLQENLLDNAEQYSRRDCLEVRGVPKQDAEENTDEIVQTIGEFIGVAIDANDISVSHWLSAISVVRDRDPAIIVKFVKRYVRDRFYNTRKHLRDKTTRDVGLSRLSEHSIYISECLTKRNRDLFNDCLKARKDLDYRFVWTQGGKIFMRKDTHTLAKYIKSQGALQGMYTRAGIQRPPSRIVASNHQWKMPPFANDHRNSPVRNSFSCKRSSLQTHENTTAGQYPPDDESDSERGLY